MGWKERFSKRKGRLNEEFRNIAGAHWCKTLACWCHRGQPGIICLFCRNHAALQSAKAHVRQCCRSFTSMSTFIHMGFLCWRVSDQKGILLSRMTSAESQADALVNQTRGRRRNKWLEWRQDFSSRGTEALGWLKVYFIQRAVIYLPG